MDGEFFLERKKESVACCTLTPLLKPSMTLRRPCPCDLGSDCQLRDAFSGWAWERGEEAAML